MLNQMTCFIYLLKHYVIFLSKEVDTQENIVTLLIIIV